MPPCSPRWTPSSRRRLPRSASSLWPNTTVSCGRRRPRAGRTSSEPLTTAASARTRSGGTPRAVAGCGPSAIGWRGRARTIGRRGFALCVGPSRPRSSAASVRPPLVLPVDAVSSGFTPAAVLPVENLPNLTRPGFQRAGITPRAARVLQPRIPRARRVRDRRRGNARGAVSERLVTAAELAEFLALAPATVLDWFEAGRLPGFKLGRVVRFRESEVLAWLEECRTGPGAGGEVLPTPTDPTRGVFSQVLPTPQRGGTHAS